MFLGNLVQVATATTGTGTVTLGAAVEGYQTFAQAGYPSSAYTRYKITDGTAWEIGNGTYSSSGPTLSRTLVQSSTGSLLNLSGSATVSVVATAQDVHPMIRITQTANAFQMPSAGSFAIAIGLSASAASSSIAIGITANASGASSIAIGPATAQSFNSVAIGVGARAVSSYAHAFPSALSRFGSDTQNLFCQTSNATPKPVLAGFNGFAFEKSLISSVGAKLFEGYLLGRETSPGTNIGIWKIEAVLVRSAANVLSLPHSSVTEIANPGSWGGVSLGTQVESGTYAFEVEVTGAASTNIDWCCTLRSVSNLAS